MSAARGAAAGALIVAVWFFLDRIAGRGNTAIDSILVGLNMVIATAQNTGASGMKTSQAGVAAIAQRERFSARRYVDAKGYSIGYGHFILLGESFNEPISTAQGTELLRSDIGIAEKAVSGYVTVPLTQGQYDALVSMVYNIGVGAFRSSTLLRLLNAGDYAGAAAQMARWNKSGGAVLAALVNRRASEYKQFFA